MTQHVWQISVDGGAPESLRTAVIKAIERLRKETFVELTRQETEAWREDIVAYSVSSPAVDGDRVSLLVDVEIHTDDERGPDLAAARLSGGFDEIVLDAVMNVDGVTGASHSDRIARP